MAGLTDALSPAPLELPAGLDARLVLVRHGESTWVAEGRFQGRGDPPLSRLGEHQASLVAERLARPSEDPLWPVPVGLPNGIWHSPLQRAAQTAQRIAQRQVRPVALYSSDGLLELGQGQWEGLPHSEVSARWPELLARWRADPTSAQGPGGEPLLEAAARVRQAAVRILAMLGEASTPGTPGSSGAPGTPAWAVLVAHDGVFRLLLMSLLGVEYRRFWSFPFNLCTLSVITLSEGVAALRAHNLSDHLAPLAAQQAAAEEARGDRRGAL